MHIRLIPKVTFGVACALSRDKSPTGTADMQAVAKGHLGAHSD